MSAETPPPVSVRRLTKKDTVRLAEEALTAAHAALAAGREEVTRLEAAVAEAQAALGAARIEADKDLPRCTWVTFGWRGTEQSRHPVVIVRRTPSGRLVVRHVGGDPAYTSTFQWNERAGVFTEVARRSFTSSYRELRDVPAAYLPAAAEVAP